MPNIVKIHHELSKKGLAVVAVNMQEDKGKVSSFLKMNQYDLPVWLDLNGEVAGKYGASAIPTLVIIDRARARSPRTWSACARSGSSGPS